MRYWLLFSIWLLILPSIYAYPVPYMGLIRLISESKYIVVAEVENPEFEIEKNYDVDEKDTVTTYLSVRDGKAKLHIKEVLKGELASLKTIHVIYLENMVCPAPPHYDDKTRVIAFLDKKETETFFTTVGLSYGSKKICNEQMVEAYRNTIISLFEIMTLKNKREIKTRMLEWLFQCVENKYTRWEGTYLLTSKKEQYVDPDFELPFKMRLSHNQRKRLSSAFFASDSIGYGELLLIPHIPKNKHGEVVAHLLKDLSHTQDKTLMSYIMNDISKLLHYNKKLPQIIKELHMLSYLDKEFEEKHRKYVAAFVAAARE